MSPLHVGAGRALYVIRGGQPIRIDAGVGTTAPPATSVLFDTDGTPYYVPGTTGDIREDTDGTPYVASTGTDVGVDTDGTPYLIGA